MLLTTQVLSRKRKILGTQQLKNNSGTPLKPGDWITLVHCQTKLHQYELKQSRDCSSAISNWHESCIWKDNTRHQRMISFESGDKHATLMPKLRVSWRRCVQFATQAHFMQPTIRTQRDLAVLNAVQKKPSWTEYTLTQVASIFNYQFITSRKQYAINCKHSDPDNTALRLNIHVIYIVYSSYSD